MNVAYLVSEYPAVSHTFIYREIQSLRDQGIGVRTASIRSPKNMDWMKTGEMDEMQNTFYIKRLVYGRFAMAHLRLFASSPRAYFKMIRTTLSLMAGISPAAILKSLGYFLEAGIFADWMHRNDLPHVHVHFANPAATVALIAASGRRLTYSLSVHGPDVFYNVEANLLRQKLVSAEFVRCISLFCRSQLMRLVTPDSWPRFHIVHCGVDLEQYSVRSKSRNEKFQILCVGRLVPAKGQHVLLKACAALKKRGINFQMTFVGDGPDRASLELRCRDYALSDNVDFVGAVGQDSIAQYYDGADVFALASFAEGVPVVLMEAMAKGIPCISTSISGIPELIKSGESGLLVAPSDEEALEQCLVQIYEDTPLGDSLGLQARRTVESQFEIKESAKRLAGLFATYAESATT